MAIINQNLDGSEKKRFECFAFGALATGVTQLLVTVPYNAILQGVNVAAFGLSGVPVHSLSIFRFNVGAGLTSIPLGVTLTLQAVGTSGPLGYSLAPPGVSLLAGDSLLLTTGVANTAIASSVVTVVISGLDDIKVYQNSVA
jgi:hypothetical protein